MANWLWTGREFGLEIPTAVLFCCMLLSGPVTINLIVYRTCYLTFGYNRTECKALGSTNPTAFTPKLEELVEPTASMITMVMFLLQCLLGGIACLFMGPSSDKFGRKPVLLVCAISTMMTYSMEACFAYLDNLNGWYYLPCVIPICFTGNIYGFCAVVNCFISDVTPEDLRGSRNGQLESFIILGILTGNLICWPVFQQLGYVGVYGTCASLVFVTFLFIIFCIPESLNSTATGNAVNQARNIYRMRDMLRVTFKQRPDYQRGVTLLTGLTIIVFIVCVQGNSALMFLFARTKFHWSLQHYTWYSSLHTGSWFFYNIVGVGILHTRFGVHESVLIFMGVISLINGALLRGLAETPTTMYVSAALDSFGAVVSPMGRALISKMVPNDEAGIIFSVLSATETMCAAAATPIYTVIYNHTLLTMPGAFNFVTIAIYLIDLIFVICVMVMSYWSEGRIYRHVKLVEEVASSSSTSSLLTESEEVEIDCHCASYSH